MYFSPGDLTQFQSNYNLPLQPAVDIGGYVTAACSSSGSGAQCNEGNLDIQYIMGVAQKTVSVYWYVGGTDPFTSWITDVANTPNPPLSNSVSWGAIEQVRVT